MRLSAGETRSAFADDRFIFLWKRFDEFVQACGSRSGGEFFIRCVRFAEANVGGDGVVEEVWTLGNPSD